jgi:DNA invertase Pin-like site-specific DNA recombinase
MKISLTTPDFKAPKSGQKIGYIRVSGIDQNPERQLVDVQLDKKFIDKCSGKTIERPEFSQMMLYLRDGDTLIVHSLDRLARNLWDLQSIVKELTDRGVTIQFLQENLTFNKTECPIATLTLSMMGAFAQFERSLLLERQREGIAIAKAKGVYSGRKCALNTEQIEELYLLQKRGWNKARIARHFSISRESVYRYLRRFPKEEECESV